MRDFQPSGSVARIRAELNHPVVDADGHCMEFMPMVVDIVREVAGADMARRVERLTDEMFSGTDGYLPVRMFYGNPARNTLDRMTVTLPRLQYRRMEEIGIDFGLVYPSVGLVLPRLPDAELRRAAIRAMNRYYAEVYREYRDRLEPVAILPTFTPGEAVAELDYVVGELGLKAVVMSGVVPRTVRPNGTRANWIDTLGHDSLYDYAPLWQRCQELKVAPTFHGIGYGWGSRVSDRNYVYNHLGQFAAAQEAVCRSLFMAGVPRRFPGLRFAFLEGGVGWGCQLYSDLLGHFAKRNREAVRQFDPAEIDRTLAVELFREHATGRLRDYAAAFSSRNLLEGGQPAGELGIDDFAESRIECEQDIVEVFRRQFFFGCEADDPMNAVAFDTRTNPNGIALNAIFASDIGHWDVTDMREVLPEVWELVEHGRLSVPQVRDFTCNHTLRMLTDVNPRFFAGTAIEAAVERWRAAPVQAAD
ncbi:MAG: amidohydrolase family protein [Gammaproteobacteria bacterium]